MTIQKTRSLPLPTPASPKSTSPAKVTPPSRPTVTEASKPGAQARARFDRDSFEAAPQSKSSPAAKGQVPVVREDSHGSTVVSLGNGNNVATVSQTRNGRLRVTSDGHSVTLTAQQSRHVTIQAGKGNDKVTVGSKVTRGLVLDGGSGRDNLKGGKGDDVLLGGSGDDILNGGAGNNLLIGQTGNDTLYVGVGRDIFGYKSGDGTDTLIRAP